MGILTLDENFFGLVNHFSSKGAKFTRGRKWILIYKKKMPSKKEAMQFEYRLKKNRKKRKVLINKFINTTYN